MNLLQIPLGEVLPASEGTLTYFAPYLGTSLHHSTIKLYLPVVRNLHVIVGFPAPIKGKLLLRKVLKGILHFQCYTPICRPLVTPWVIYALRPLLQSKELFYVLGCFALVFFCISPL